MNTYNIEIADDRPELDYPGLDDRKNWTPEEGNRFLSYLIFEAGGTLESLVDGPLNGWTWGLRVTTPVQTLWIRWLQCHQSGTHQIYWMGKGDLEKRLMRELEKTS